MRKSLVLSIALAALATAQLRRAKRRSRSPG